MRIVLIDKEEGLKVGGVQIYTERLYQYLLSQNHQVAILRFSNQQKKEKNIYPIPYYLAEPRSYIFLPSEKTLTLLRQHLQKLKPEIVYMSIGISPLDFLIPSLCHDLNLPLAGVWHGDYSESPSSLQVLVKSIFLAYLPFCRQLDLLHVFSQKLATFYQRRGIEKKRFLVLPNGVDSEFYRPGVSQFAQKRKINQGILFLGRITYVKNPEILIKSFLSLNPSYQTKLLLVGCGDQEKKLREKYQDRRIIFTGLIKEERKKIDIIRACQIFVLPSKYEGMSLALLEAMSCGLACITSDAGANNELVQDAGILIQESRLKEELPFALRLLLAYPEFVQMLGKKARQKIEKNYSQKIIFAKIVQALEKTIKDYKTFGPPKTFSFNFTREFPRKLNVILSKLSKLSSSLSDFS